MVQAGHTLDVLVDVGVAGGRAGAGGGGGVAAVGILLVSIVSMGGRLLELATKLREDFTITEKANVRIRALS